MKANFEAKLVERKRTNNSWTGHVISPRLKDGSAVRSLSSFNTFFAVYHNCSKHSRVSQPKQECTGQPGREFFCRQQTIFSSSTKFNWSTRKQTSVTTWTANYSGTSITSWTAKCGQAAVRFPRKNNMSWQIISRRNQTQQTLHNFPSKG